jgi:hypothetical protein
MRGKRRLMCSIGLIFELSGEMLGMWNFGAVLWDTLRESSTVYICSWSGLWEGYLGKIHLYYMYFL